MTDPMRAALDYVADMTCIGADAEWHFKPGYDPQRVLDALASTPPTPTPDDQTCKSCGHIFADGLNGGICMACENAECERILAMSPEEIDAHIRAQGDDPAQVVRRFDILIKNAIEIVKLRKEVERLSTPTPTGAEIDDGLRARIKAICKLIAGDTSCGDTADHPCTPENCHMHELVAFCRHLPRPDIDEKMLRADPKQIAKALQIALGEWCVEHRRTYNVPMGAWERLVETVIARLASSPSAGEGK